MTIEELARDLGVSKSTVSRALSGKGRIGQETRKRVRDYAREMGLLPEPGGDVEQGRMRNIGLVIPADAYSTSIPFFQDCLLGICESASMQEYNVLITTGTVDDISGIRTLVEKKKVDGIILTRSMEEDKAVQYLTEAHFPVGMTGTCEYDQVIQVDADSGAASENLTSMLIGRGYRRFALIVENLTYKVNKNRHDGFCNALKKHGLSREQQVFCTSFNQLEYLDNLIGDLMARKVECIVCGDDVICTRVMSKLQAEGYRIPMDISIVSLYNSSNLSCFSPGITAVNISARLIGNIIGKQMINYLLGKEYEKKTLVDYEILFRKSADKVYRRQPEP